MTNSINKNNKISALYFYLTLLVVWLHATIDTSSLPFVFKILNLSNQLGIVAVPTFFFISGYLFSRNYSSFKLKIITRFRTVLIPYLLCRSILVLIQLIIAALIGREYIDDYIKIDSFQDIILGFFVYDISVLWYMRNLLFYILLSPIIINVFKYKKMGLMVLLVTCIFCFHFQSNYFSLPYWIVFYSLGLWTGIHFPQFMYRQHNNTFSITIIVAWLLLFMLSIIDTKFSNYETYLIRLVSPFLTVAVIDMISAKVKFVDYPIYKYSFFIYVFHYQFLTYATNYIFNSSRSIYAIIFCYFIIPIATVALCIIVGYVMKHHFPRAYSLICGGR